MATCEEADPTVCESDEEPWPQEEDEDEEEEEEEDEDELFYQTRERGESRSPADVLLHLGEEAYLKDLEPHRYHLYTGAEEAVRGWDRVAPLSCILLSKKKDEKPEQTEADKPNTDPTPVPAGSSGGTTAHRRELDPGGCDPHVESWISTAEAALQLDTKKWPSVNAVQKTTSHRSPETAEEVRTVGETFRIRRPSSKCTVSDKRPVKPPKHNIVVPIKTYTFLPPIKTSYLNPKFDGQTCSDRKASGGEKLQERGFMEGSRSGKRGSSGSSRRRGRKEEPGLPNHPAVLTSKHQTWQHASPLSYIGTVAIPKRYEVPVSSKMTQCITGAYFMDKSLTQGNSAPRCPSLFS